MFKSTNILKNKNITNLKIQIYLLKNTNIFKNTNILKNTNICT